MEHFYSFSELRVLKIKETHSNGSNTRSIYYPGSDITHLPQSIQDAAAAMWTQDVIDAYQSAQQEAL